MMVAEVDPSLADLGPAERRCNHPLLQPFWHAGGQGMWLIRPDGPDAEDFRPLTSWDADVLAPNGKSAVLCSVWNRTLETQRRGLFGRRPPVTVAWGNAPGICPDQRVMAEGHVQNRPPRLNMAFGQETTWWHSVPGALPQATVKNGLRPTHFVADLTGKVPVLHEKPFDPNLNTQAIVFRLVLGGRR